MWNNLLKISVVSYIWKRYKRTLIALPLLLLYFWIVGLIHQDFLTFAALKEADTWIGLSFIIKWLLMFAGACIFVAFHLMSNQDESTKSKIKKKFKPSFSAQDSDNATETSDPFENIRQKKKLNSKADQVINNKK